VYAPAGNPIRAWNPFIQPLTTPRCPRVVHRLVIWDTRDSSNLGGHPVPRLQFAEVEFYTDDDVLIPVASCTAVKSRVETCRKFCRSRLYTIPRSRPFVI